MYNVFQTCPLKLTKTGFLKKEYDTSSFKVTNCSFKFIDVKVD